ncbi:hypothetical protein GCM10007332_02180 [Epilithonimonas arachidiradicis]|uniref:Uncharacterized protein n=1 Tax=Epilithonimonas arachidiradicis TaxID=1617282 RepID=A0ABQ1WT45_9FLAO|nr:hypothetical protein GCM10007332_02180 [Epilithonimonas arachidiradicis]
MTSHSSAESVFFWVDKFSLESSVKYFGFDEQDQMNPVMTMIANRFFILNIHLLLTSNNC